MFQKYEFSKSWRNPADFPSVESDETKIRDDLQILHDESRDALHALIEALAARDGAASIGADDGGTAVSLQALLTSLRQHEHGHTNPDEVNRLAAAFAGFTPSTTIVSDDTKIPTAKAVHDQIAAAGGGDMLRAVYDPQNKREDVYAHAARAAASCLPRNLLDNGDLCNPINQRCAVSGDSVAAGKYFLDRWYNGGTAAAAFSFTEDGLTVPASATLTQAVERKLTGNSCTFAIGLSDGSIVLTSGTVTEASDGSSRTCFTATASSCTLTAFTLGGYLRLSVRPSRAVTLRWAALYEGTYTKDTLPLWQPKGRSEEYLSCCRYFFRNDHDSGARATSAQWLLTFVQFPVMMRAIPTVSSVCIYNDNDVDISESFAAAAPVYYATETGMTWIEVAHSLFGDQFYTVSADFSADL